MSLYQLLVIIVLLLILLLILLLVLLLLLYSYTYRAVVLRLFCFASYPNVYFVFIESSFPLYYNIFQRHRVLHFHNIRPEYFIRYTFFPVHFAFYDASAYESLEKLHRVFFFMTFQQGKDRIIESRGLKMRLCQSEN